MNLCRRRRLNRSWSLKFVSSSGVKTSLSVSGEATATAGSCSFAGGIAVAEVSSLVFLTVSILLLDSCSRRATRTPY